MFKIGDFSRLARVSVRMLRHYDEIGLLKPAEVDRSTGYRFYSVDQIPVVNRIHVLREMGFSLSETMRLMAGGLDAAQLILLLENKQQEITESLEREREKLHRVGAWIDSLHKENGVMEQEIHLKAIPAYKVIALRDAIGTYREESLLWDELQQFIAQNQIRVEAPCYAIYHDPSFKEADVDVEVTMCVAGDVTGNGRIVTRELEAVPEMAIIFHRGPFEEMTNAYHALGKWIAANGYGMDGATRAIYHKGPWSEKNPADYLTELQVPVRKYS